MSTPPPTLQQSSTATYNSAIQSLEGAQGKLVLLAQEVQGEKATLATSYQGEDGQMFQQVLDQWLRGEEYIHRKCQDLIDALTTTMKASGKAQGGNVHLVMNETNHPVYNALMG
ncbi:MULTISPECIES: hypothetical protein [Streptomyces]|uniref:hypothetical protein n=1 Tax=Streptomyces TaxID=1883 RepID=UPI00240DEAAE|nr:MULTISPECIES: hypothetical protein [Streptomyces]WFB88506.1 hypothetical protein MMU79_37335 [Streptomyces olivaceus]WGK50948.1 hypothetical protein M6G09_38075 [Streptomyces sp. B146]